MIGVFVRPHERESACEFFELCKTPWEFWQHDGNYHVLLCTFEPPIQFGNAVLVLIFSGEALAFDSEIKVLMKPLANGVLDAEWVKVPLYCRAGSFGESGMILARESLSRLPLIIGIRRGSTLIARIGYNVFEETHALLTKGQPEVHASIPTLDLHIELLRALITGAGLPLVEIPPVPWEYSFIACLTHDVDHPVLRNHFGDATMLGFLYRATVGSLHKCIRNEMPLRNLARNWAAACTLPLVYLRLMPDEWQRFDRYTEIEGGRPSTFFVIPKKDSPGKRRNGLAPAKRGARYEPKDIKQQLDKLLSAGSEVALHGLNSWLSVDEAQKERHLLAATPGANTSGVRMHWLYFDEDSPPALDQAGFAYDSSVGYNATVGFRAGTSQVFRPLGTTNLLELPLNVMDTALFYPDYLNLSEATANRVVAPIIDSVERTGGAFTINWHDRSIAPERLWETFYRQTIEKLQSRRAWFARADRAVGWFRMRRSAVFESVSHGPRSVTVRSNITAVDVNLPKLRMRLHKPKARNASDPFVMGHNAEFVDFPLLQNSNLTMAL